MYTLIVTTGTRSSNRRPGGGGAVHRWMAGRLSGRRHDGGVRLGPVVGVGQGRPVLGASLEVAVSGRLALDGERAVRPRGDEAHARAGRAGRRGVREVAGHEVGIGGARIHAVIKVADKKRLQRRVRRVPVAVDGVGGQVEECGCVGRAGDAGRVGRAVSVKAVEGFRC